MGDSPNCPDVCPDVCPNVCPTYAGTRESPRSTRQRLQRRSGHAPACRTSGTPLTAALRGLAYAGLVLQYIYTPKLALKREAYARLQAFPHAPNCAAPWCLSASTIRAMSTPWRRCHHPLAPLSAGPQQSRDKATQMPRCTSLLVLRLLVSSSLSYTCMCLHTATSWILILMKMTSFHLTWNSKLAELDC